MRFLLLILLAGTAAVLPFVLLKRPWALRLWGRTRVLFVIYALVILLAATLGLIFRWEQFYG